MGDKTLKESLARYMDNKAFVAKAVGKEQAARLKVRREIALKRAGAAIRFFSKPTNLAHLQRRVNNEGTDTNAC